MADWNKNNELDERELERITGGEGEGYPFNSPEWTRKNCSDCANNGACQNISAYLLIAKEKAKQGKNNDCPFKC